MLDLSLDIFLRIGTVTHGRIVSQPLAVAGLEFCQWRLLRMRAVLRMQYISVVIFSWDRHLQNTTEGQAPGGPIRDSTDPDTILLFSTTPVKCQ